MKTLTTLQIYFFLPLAFCFALTAQAQTAFFTEDFETDGQDVGTGLTASGDQARYTASTPFRDASSDHWNRTDGSNISNVSGAYSSYSGTYFWAAEDTDDNGGNGSDDQYLDITGIDITGKNGLQFKGLFGAGNEGGVGASKYDSVDFIKIQVQIDGGGYNDALWFSFLDPGGSDNDNEPFGVDRDFDGSADSADDLLGTTLQSYSADISGTGSTLDIKIHVHMEYASEEIAFDNIQILEATGQEAITLSATPTTVDEGSTLAVTLSVPTIVGTDTVFNLSTSGDDSELSIPSTVTITSGTDSVDFNVSGLSDGVFDGDQAVTVTAEQAGYFSDTLDITVIDADSATASGDLIISQYYEGSSNNKYLEITNIGDSSIDLTGYSMVAWFNDLSEAYKTATAFPGEDDPNYNDVTSLDLTSLGIIESNQTMIFANSGAVSPVSPSAADLSLGWPSPVHFNGNDSIVIYNSATPNPANIVDAIGFTSGFEGGNKSFVRAGAFQGYDLTAGSSASSPQFSTIWTEITNGAADAASYGDDGFIGTTALAIAPTVVNFTTTNVIVTEDGESEAITVAIFNPDGVNSVSVDVVFNSGSSTADATDIDSYTTQTVTFPSTAVSGDAQDITVTLTDDSDVEGDEEAIFNLSNLVSSSINAQVGSADTATLMIQDDDVIIPEVIISEISDPNGTGGGNSRFVELYNATDSTIDLAAGSWTLVKYVQTGTISAVSLTGSISAGGTYVIAMSESTYTTSYGKSPDQANGDISGNGDDAYALFFSGNNTTGRLVDLYGDIGDGTGGIDGSFTAWEYEDGRAVRNPDITSPSETFTASEWTIYNDSDSTNGVANVADMTPGVHPDPLVDVPTGVTATTVSDTETSIAFTAVDSNNVIVVSDADGTFTAPSGSSPSLGDSFAGGTVIYVGQVSPFAHTGLTGGTQYYYSVFSVNGTDYSSTIEVDATTQVAGQINSETFATSSAQWTPQAIAGTSAPGWNNDNSGTAVVDGYVLPSGSASTEIHYLVSPELDFSSVTGTVTVSLDYEGAANTVDDSLKLVYSTSYAGSGDPEDPNTWTEVDFTFVNTNSGDPTSVLNDSAEITLPSSLNGQSTVYLALRYEAGGEASNSEYWTIDNILVVEAAAADPVANYLTVRSLTSDDLGTDSNGNGFTVLEEYLAGFGDGSGPDAISYGIVNNALTLTSDLESAPSGITVVLEATSDLGVAFASVAFTTSVVENADGTYTRSYTETSPPAGGQRFLRLSITTD